MDSKSGPRQRPAPEPIEMRQERLVNGVLHGANNLLSAAMGFTEQLEELENDSRDAMECRESILEALSQTRSLMLSLLAFRTAGSLPSGSSIRIKPALQAVQRLIPTFYGKTKFAELEVDPRADLRVSSEESMMLRLLMMLALAVGDRMGNQETLHLELRAEEGTGAGTVEPAACAGIYASPLEAAGAVFQPMTAADWGKWGDAELMSAEELERHRRAYQIDLQVAGAGERLIGFRAIWPARRGGWSGAAAPLGPVVTATGKRKAVLIGIDHRYLESMLREALERENLIARRIDDPLEGECAAAILDEWRLEDPQCQGQLAQAGVARDRVLILAGGETSAAGPPPGTAEQRWIRKPFHMTDLLNQLQLVLHNPSSARNMST